MSACGSSAENSQHNLETFSMLFFFMPLLRLHIASHRWQTKLETVLRWGHTSRDTVRRIWMVSLFFPNISELYLHPPRVCLCVESGSIYNLWAVTVKSDYCWISEPGEFESISHGPSLSRLPGCLLCIARHRCCRLAECVSAWYSPCGVLPHL